MLQKNQARSTWNFLPLCIFHGWLMIQVSSNITFWEVTTSKTVVLKIILSIFSFKFRSNLFLVIESVTICIYLDWFVYLRVCGSDCIFFLFSVIVSWHQLYCLISIWIKKNICWENTTYDKNYQPTYIKTSYGIHSLYHEKEYTMRNAELEETQGGIEIAGRNINNLMQMTPPLWQKVKKN